ncbi:dihydrofolate reductase-like domain-containing protein [Lentinula edodes]|nr:dihydrofolate reductase-like domain-containing protein [Lentinula edodes]
MSKLTLIVAATRTNGIGEHGKLPWHLPKEMSYFQRVTCNAPSGQKNAVVMGRHTWESIPEKFRPLKDRVNVVISRKENYHFGESVQVHRDLASAMEQLRSQSDPDVHRTFLIGGAMLYSACLQLPKTSPIAFVDRVLLTRVIAPSFDRCNVFVPDFLGEWIGAPDFNGWKQATPEAMSEWVGFEVPEGVQEENGVQYEYQLWVRDST